MLQQICQLYGIEPATGLVLTGCISSWRQFTFRLSHWVGFLLWHYIFRLLLCFPKDWRRLFGFCIKFQAPVCVSQPRHLHILSIFVVEIVLINIKGYISDWLASCWLQWLNVVRLLSVADVKGIGFCLFVSLSLGQLLNLRRTKLNKFIPSFVLQFSWRLVYMVSCFMDWDMGSVI